MAHYGARLGTDPPLANHNPAIFSALQLLKNLISPSARQKSFLIPMCYTLNTNTYNDFRTTYKHVLIPSYINQVT